MPGHDEEHKAGPGKHGAHGHKPGDGHGHGSPGREGPAPHHGGSPGRHGGPPGPGGRGGRKKKGGRGKKRPDDDEDTEDEDSEEEDDDEDPCDDDEEEKMPGLRRAGRIAGKKWKREHGIDKKTKHMTPEEKKQIRAVKRAARAEFRKHARKG